MVNINTNPAQFIEDLVRVAKDYGWQGDYTEIRGFVADVIEDFGFDSNDYDLTPNE